MNKKEGQENNAVPSAKNESQPTRRKRKSQAQSPLEKISKRARGRYIRHLDEIRRKSIDMLNNSSDSP